VLKARLQGFNPEALLRPLEDASYDPITNVIFYPRPYRELYDGIRLPYDMPPEGFWRNWTKIQDRLRVFHETAHFFQTRGTFQGFLLFEVAMREIQEIKMIVEECEFELPLRDHFIKLYPETRRLGPNDTFLLAFLFSSWLRWFRRWQEGTCFSGPVQECSGEKPTIIAVSDAPAFPWQDKSNRTRLAVSLSYPPRDFRLTTELGALQLFESYAQSVEFEHLMWFNKAEGDRVLHRFLYDPHNIDYTVAVSMFTQGLPHAYLDEMPFLYAHLRAVIDLSLMAHGALLSGTALTFDEPGPSCVLDSMIHPGQTFLGALEALPAVRPARDTKDDLLRFYDDLCSALGLPNLGTINRLANETAKATTEHLNKGKVSEPQASGFVEMLSYREEDPLFFINDMIFSDR
jgi:hypothetical protein